MKSMGERVHDELGRVVDSYVPSPGLLEHIETRTRHRARRRRRAAVGVVALLVVASGVAVLADRRGGTTTVASLAPASTTAPAGVPATVSPSGPGVSGPGVTTPATPVIPAPAPPPSFLAAVGAGNEQAVVVDTASGSVVRRVDAAPPGQFLWAVSPDGATLYAATQQSGGCGRSYVAIDTATGVSRGPAWSGIGGLTSIAPAPDGQTLAYTADCSAQLNVSDVFLRRPNGSVMPLAAGGHVIQLSWSHDGTMLAFQVGTTVQVWIIGSTSASGPHVVAAPDSGCSLELPRFAGNGLFAVETCPSGNQGSAPVTLRLVLLDSTTGVQQRSWMLAQAPYANVADLAVDPTGGWALYSHGSYSNTLVNGQVSLLALTPATENPRLLLSDAFEVAWLPAPTNTTPATPKSVP